MQVGGIILAGGQSRRMGMAKADLQFGSETLLARMVRIVSEAELPVIVVAAKNQSLPPLESPPLPARPIKIVSDRTPNRGPLEGMAAGLIAWQAANPQLDAVFVTACDTPLVRPAFIRRLIELADENHEVVAPLVDGWPHPLLGVYRTTVLAKIENMLAENQLRMRDLLAGISTRYALATDFADIDPNMRSVRNLNTPDDYRAALAAAGLASENQK